MIKRIINLIRDKGDIKDQNGLIYRLHIDAVLFSLILIVAIFGFFVLYSAGNQSTALITRQAIRLGIAVGVMFVVAQFPPKFIRIWSPVLYFIGLVMLLAVFYAGDVGKGAKRWLDLGFMRFQPSELMKLAVPMMVAWYLHFRPLPASLGVNFIALTMIAIPTAFISIQPDLGTSLLIAASGVFIILLAGLSMRFILLSSVVTFIAAPIYWFTLMKEYQKTRVLTFLNPENDPLGAGYNIIQSKIAIGSGGIFGKGWLNGTQGQLEFLPERKTDFIFAVLGEEFGLIGLIILILIYTLIIIRGLVIASQANDTYERLLAGSISLTFFVYVFVNTGMVTGLLPVVGLPLPLISYGGTSMVTLMAGFGILMSIHTHKRMFSNLN